VPEMPYDLRGLHRINPPAGVADWIGRGTRPPLAVRAGCQPSQNVLDYRQGQPLAEFIASKVGYLSTIASNIILHQLPETRLPLPVPPPVPRITDFELKSAKPVRPPPPLRVSRARFGVFNFIGD